ncbi:ATP-binding protein [Pseudomonas graminis]
MAKPGIRYQLFILTSKVAVSTLVLLSVVYSVYIGIFYDGKDEYTWIPSSHDWILTLISGLLSAAVALYFVWGFAKRVIIPLNAVAHSARQVAEGNLSIRAEHSTSEIRETALLIDDFNSMAEKLEVMSHEMKKWNAAIAHELRTPVTVLQGRIQGMVEGIFDRDDRQFAILLRQTEGLSRLIDDLRVLSLSDSGQLYLYRETLHLKEILTSSVDSFRDQLKQRGLEPVIEAEDIVCFIDEVRLRQVLFALLSNASKYAVPGVVMITCRTSSDAIVLTVEDEGPGIGDADQGTVFDAFYRAENDRVQKPDGSGLGLAVVYAIARAHGGSARCLRSRLGGTCMQITLPGSGK